MFFKTVAINSKKFQNKGIDSDFLIDQIIYV